MSRAIREGFVAQRQRLIVTLIYVNAQPAALDSVSTMEWNPIVSAPLDRDLELAVIDSDGPHALVFPCRRIVDGWVDAQTGKQVYLDPTHWRNWQRPALFFSAGSS
jgi:hypothetical protein